MGRCSGCGSGCNCIIRQGAGTKVTGAGTQANPYVIEATGGSEGGGGGRLPGEIIGYGGAVAPAGWLIANGQAVSRTAYAALYAAIGILYGSGDGATTFNVPDLAGRFPLGSDGSHPLGAQQGAESTTLTASHIPQHSHTIAHTHDASHAHTASAAATNTDHLHYWASGYSGGHSHVYHMATSTRGFTTGGASGFSWETGNYNTGGDGGHSHEGWTGAMNQNAAHSHTITVNTASFSTGAPSVANSGNYGTASPTAVPTMPPWTGITYLIKT